MKTSEEGALFDAEHIEKVEQQLDQFVEKRAREAQDQGRIDELWAVSERRERRKRRESNGLAWIDYHERLANFHRTLAGEHEERAEHVRGLLASEMLPAPSKNGNHQMKPEGD